MDPKDILNYIVPIVTAVIGYFLKTVITDVKELQNNFNDFRQEIPERYATKVDVNRDVDRVLDAIREVSAKLDSAIAHRRSTDRGD